MNANYAKYIETVKTNILITLVLVMGMTLAGFSKEESENMSMEEKQVADIKQHIIGTWEHDGDFMCDDISELSANIDGRIISGCTSEFINRNPATLIFRNDGSLVLNKKGAPNVDPDKEYKGTYTVSTVVNELWQRCC